MSEIITLPSGRTAVFTRSLKVRDAVTAQRVVKDGTDVERAAALIAQVVELDGHKVVMEDLLDLSLEDFNVLGENLGKAPSPAPQA